MAVNNSMKKINISTRKYPKTFTIVDDENYDYLNQWKWYKSYYGYAVRMKIIKNKTICIYMHRLISGDPKRNEIDHINGNRLDNRKKNLRTCTPKQNSRNRKAIQSKLYCHYKGVCYDKHKKEWESSLWINRKRIERRRFDSCLEGVLYYNKIARKYYGAFSKVNEIEFCA
jgi:hypothetical protein